MKAFTLSGARHRDDCAVFKDASDFCAVLVLRIGLVIDAEHDVLALGF